MEEEFKIIESSKPRSPKKRQRSWSDDPLLTFHALRRVRRTYEFILEFAPKSPCTKCFHPPFTSPLRVVFKIQSDTKIQLNVYKSNLLPGKIQDFNLKYNSIMDLITIITNKVEKPPKEKKPKLSACKSKHVELTKFFEAEEYDIKYLAEMTNLPRHQVQTALNKYKSKKDCMLDFRGRKPKLTQIHKDFIINYFADKKNIHKEISELHQNIITHFNLDTKEFSVWTLYNCLESLNFTYKNIIYKVINANCSTVKNKRIETALILLEAHFMSYDFIYIDEASFNLELWPSKGWAPKGSKPCMSRPSKSLNYSVIMAMDLKGILCAQVIKGGVKGADFFLFIKELTKAHEKRFESRKVILFMDNASVHKSKDYMQKITTYYNILYNSPYTPQFNPIEFAFSKIKYLFRKSKVTTERVLVQNILNACAQITEVDAANFIINSMKFYKDAIENKDFF